VEITWYGLSCFRLREQGVTVVCDPFSKKATGLTLPRVRADVVTVSHDRPGHNHVKGVTGQPKVLTGPGEYEVKNVLIVGLATYHKAPQESKLGRNIAFFFDFGSFTVGHLGDLGEIPSQKQVEDVTEVDVLLVPVSGERTLDTSKVTEVISMLEPKLVIPMHYRHPGLAPKLAEKLEPVDKLLKELGVSDPEEVSTLKISRSGLPDETKVILLEPSSA